MRFILKDYNEKGVITPKSWFKSAGKSEKLNEIKNIKKYLITFSYMKDFIEKAKSVNFRKVEWYPDLGVFEFEEESIGLIISPIGAPAITTILEELICMGGKYFILAGGVGVLFKEIKRGGLIIPDGAIRDEGTSYHYLPPEKEVKPSASLFKKLNDVCKDTGVEYHVGKVWTTDAPYRETPSRIRVFRSKGAICVDMELSGCFAVAEYRKIDLAAIFLGYDYVKEDRWVPRKKETDKSKGNGYQEKMFYIACKTLKEVGQ